MPDSLPRARTRSPGLAGGDPLDSGRSRSRRIWALSTRRRGWSREGKNDPVRSSGMASSTSPAVVATVLRRLPLRLLVRSLVRDVAPRADHTAAAPASTRPARPGRGQTPEDARPARSGSARTSRISVDTAHWFVAGIVGALLSESWSKNWGSHDARRPPGPADPSTPRARGNCHHTKRRTPHPRRVRATLGPSCREPGSRQVFPESPAPALNGSAPRGGVRDRAGRWGPAAGGVIGGRGDPAPRLGQDGADPARAPQPLPCAGRCTRWISATGAHTPPP